MGNVPIIEFIKEKSQFKIHEVFKRLTVADFGEDFQHSTTKMDLENITLPISTLVKPTKLKKLSDDELESGSEEWHLSDDMYPTEPQLILRSDIYGLDHDKLMKRVLSYRSRTSQLKDKTMSVDETVSEEDRLFIEQRQKELSQFLKSRKIALLKAKKQKQLESQSAENAYQDDPVTDGECDGYESEFDDNENFEEYPVNDIKSPDNSN